MVEKARSDPAGLCTVTKGPQFAYTLERRANLLALAGRNKGSITPEVMMEMMATPLDQGGPLLEGSRFVTCYQMVVVPSALGLWVRVPGFQEWTAIDLETLLSS
jgi:hypothetical protein